MKKYLLTSAAALAFCGLFTSCTHDFDNDGGSAAQNSVMKTYEQAFITAFGQPDPNQEWGFGSSTVASTRAMTRTDKPTKPSFRDGNDGMPDFNKPTKPGIPTFYNTVTEAKNAGVVVVAAENQYVESPENNATYSVNGNTTFNYLEHFSGITLYVTDNMELTAGFSANGNTIVVTQGKKLKLGSVNQKVSVYLAEDATLELTKAVTFDNNGKSSMASFYMSERSTLTGASVTFKNYYHVINNGGTISLNNDNQNLTLEKSQLWNEGTVTVKGNLTTTNGDVSIYNKGSLTVEENLTLYKAPLWNEGTVTIKGNLNSTEGENSIFNAANKTINVTGNCNLTNNKDILYNNGTFTTRGNIKMKDGTTQVINNAILRCEGNLDMTAGGAFHNVGETTITGHSYIYNTNSSWMNDGHYTTGTFDDQNCEKVFNNCYMTVTGDFHLGVPAAANGHSFFTIEGGGEGERESGAYVYCGGDFIYGGNTDLWLGNKSYLEVIGEFKSTNINKPYGVHGPESGSYAVIKAKSFTQDNNAKDAERCITFFGKLYIDAPIQYNNYVAEGTNVLIKSSHPEKPVKIPSTGCSPGYNNDDDDDDSDPNVIRVICEDLSVTQASDWDFNDAVFDVKLVENNSKVEITLRAAGGTLLLNVAGREVHELFKEFNPNANPAITSTSMVSTGSTDVRGKYTNINLNAPVFTIDNKFGTTDVKEIAKAIPVQVFKLVNGVKDWYDIEWRKGAPSARIGVGTDYNWCDERTDIRDQFKATYSGNDFSTFRMYVGGILGDNWYNVDTVSQEEVERYIAE